MSSCIIQCENRIVSKIQTDKPLPLTTYSTHLMFMKVTYMEIGPLTDNCISLWLTVLTLTITCWIRWKTEV